MKKYIFLSIFLCIASQVKAMNEAPKEKETRKQFIARARKYKSDGLPKNILSAVCPNKTITMTLAPLDQGLLPVPTLIIEKDGVQYEKQMEQFYYQAIGISTGAKRIAMIYYAPLTAHCGKTWLDIQRISLQKNEEGKNIIVTRKRYKHYLGAFCATVVAFNKQTTLVMTNDMGMWRNKDIDSIFLLKKKIKDEESNETDK